MKALIGIFVWALAVGLCFAGPVASTQSNNVLVLIQPSLAGPNVNPMNYWQPQWVLWPPSMNDSNGGRLLSIATGDNWVGSSADFQFDLVEGGKAWRSRNYQQLISRGHFTVRGENLGLVRTEVLVKDSGSVSPNALRIALGFDSPIVRPVRISEPNWPKDCLMVTEAYSWDEIAEISRRTRGRILVVEYPPLPETPWTRYWLRGSEWAIAGKTLRTSADSALVAKSTDFVVPGLLKARLLVPFLLHPGKFEVQEVSLRNWPGANRFLEINKRSSFLIGALWMILSAGLCIWAVTVVTSERTNLALPTLLSGVLLSPAAVVLAGFLGKTLGVDYGWLWISLSVALLTLASRGMSIVMKRRLPRAHPLLAVFAIGLSVICSVDPIWSFLSPVFCSRPSAVSAISLGALLGYLTGFIASFRGCGRSSVWVGRITSLALLICGLALKTWWIADLGALSFISVAATVIGEGLFSWPMLIGFVAWPTSWIPIYTGGFIWAPLGLIRSSHDRVGVNLAYYVDFISSVSLAICILMACGAAIFGFRFFFHQLRKLVKLDDRRTALPFVAIASFGFGCLHPSFLLSALTVGVGAALAVLFDAVLTM